MHDGLRLYARDYGPRQSALLPVVCLVTAMPAFLLVTGDGDLFAGSGSTSVLWASLLALAVISAMVLWQGRMGLDALIRTWMRGAGDMLPIATVLLLALLVVPAPLLAKPVEFPIIVPPPGLHPPPPPITLEVHPSEVWPGETVTVRFAPVGCESGSSLPVHRGTAAASDAFVHEGIGDTLRQRTFPEYRPFFNTRVDIQRGEIV